MGLFLLQLQDWTYKMKTKFWSKSEGHYLHKTLAASLIILLSEMLNISKKSANNKIFWRKILNIK
jgi:hypothetical protein